MKYRTIGSDPATRRPVSVLSLGAMLMGSRTDEATSFAILHRYVEAGGTFVDTSGNYAFWVNGTQGGESEELLGRWRRSRGIGAEVVIATKVGARPLAPAAGFEEAALEGLSAKVIRESAARSMSRLGVSRLDLLYAHIDDPSVPLAETVGAFGELAASGEVGLLGVSNQWSWRVERARSVAGALGVPGYEVLQYSHIATCGRGPTCRGRRGRRTRRPGRRAGSFSVMSATSRGLRWSRTRRCCTAVTPRPTGRWAPSSTTRGRRRGFLPCGPWRPRPERRPTRWCWPG